MNFGSRLSPVLIVIVVFDTFLRYEDVYAKLLAKHDWKRLAALTEDGMKYTQYITNMESTLKEKGIDLIMNKKFTRDSNKERQLEKFKTVSVKTVSHFDIANKFSHFTSSISKN